MKVCLVTGGGGFIGTNLIQSLLEKEYKVVCLDNFSSGTQENIKTFLKNKNFRFAEHDVKEKLQINGQVDYIFHLASRASPKDFAEFPLDILETNVKGTINMLEIAKRKNARFLLASTSEVYGQPLEHPQKEGYRGNVSTTGPRACYDESKRIAETGASIYFQHKNVDVRIARIFNTYGPHMRKDDGRIIPQFIHQALENKPITVYGNGTQTRSFCYVADLVEGLERMMFKHSLEGEIINLGSDQEMRIIDVAHKIKELLESSSPITHQPLPKDDPLKRKPDLTQAKKLLNWEPKMTFNWGLMETIGYFKAKQGIKI